MANQNLKIKVTQEVTGNAIAKLRAEVQALAKELQAVTKELTKIQALTFKEKILKVKSDLKEVDKQINEIAKKSLSDKTIKFKVNTKEIDKQLSEIAKKSLSDKTIKIKIDAADAIKKVTADLKAIQNLVTKIKLIPDVSQVKDFKTVIPDKVFKIKTDNADALKKVDDVIKKTIPEKIVKIKTVTDGKDTKTAVLPDKIVKVKADTSDVKKKLDEVNKTKIPDKVLKVKTVTDGVEVKKNIPDKTFKIKTDNTDAVKKVDEVIKKIIPEKVLKVKTVTDGKETKQTATPDKIIKIKIDNADAIKKVDEVSKKTIPDKTVKVKGDVTDINKKIDEVSKKTIPEKVLKIKTVTDGKETKAAGITDKTIKVKVDNADALKKLDDVIKKTIPDKIVKVKTIVDGKEVKPVVSDKTIKIKSESDALKKIDEVIKKVIPDKTVKIKGDNVEALKKIDEVTKKAIADKVVKIKTVTDGKEIKTTAIPDKVVKVKGDTSDVTKKIDDVIKKTIPDKTIKVKTVIDDKTPTTGKTKTNEIKLKVDSTDATKKIDEVSKKVIPEKVAKVKADTTEATKKIDDTIKKPIPDKTSKIKADTSDVNKKIDETIKKVIPDKLVKIKTEEIPQKKIPLIISDGQVNVIRTLQAELRKLGAEQVRLYASTGSNSDAFRKNQTEIKNLTNDLRTLQGVTKGFSGKKPLSGLQLLEAGENITTVTRGLKDAFSGLAQIGGASIDAGAKLKVLRDNSVLTAEGLELLRTATAGTVSETGLLQLNNQANLLNITLNDQARILSFVESRFDLFAGNVPDGFQKVLTAVQGGTRGLKTLGINTADYTQRLQKLVNAKGGELEITTDVNGEQDISIKKLPALEQGNLRVAAALDIMGVSLSDVKNKTQDTRDKIEGFKVAVEEAKSEVGLFLANGLEKLIDSFGLVGDSGQKTAATFVVIGGAAGDVLPILAALRIAFAGMIPASVISLLSGLVPVLVSVGGTLATMAVPILAVASSFALMATNIKAAIDTFSSGGSLWDFLSHGSVFNKFNPDETDEGKKRHTEIVEDVKNSEIKQDNKVKDALKVNEGKFLKWKEEERLKSDKKINIGGSGPGRTGTGANETANTIAEITNEITEANKAIDELNKKLSITTSNTPLFQKYTIDIQVLQDKVNFLSSDLSELQKISSQPVNVKVEVDRKDLDLLEFALSDLQKIPVKVEVETVRQSIEQIDDTEIKRKAREEELRVQEEADAKRIEMFSTILSETNNIVSILNLGAETFVGKLLTGLNDAVSLANSILNILSFFTKVASGGIFGFLGGLFGGGGGASPGLSLSGGGGGASSGRSISPTTFVNSSSRQPASTINLRVDSQYMKILQDHLPQYYDRKNSFKVSY